MIISQRQCSNEVILFQHIFPKTFDHHTLYEIYKSTFIKRNGFFFKCILVFPCVNKDHFIVLILLSFGVFLKIDTLKIYNFRIPGHHFVSCFELYHRIQDNFYKLTNAKAFKEGLSRIICNGFGNCISNFTQYFLW